jgi:hypothetical protein
MNSNQKILYMLQEFPRISIEEKKNNELAFEQFQFAFHSENYNAMDNLLDKKGVFFGVNNNFIAISNLHKLLNYENKNKKFLVSEVSTGFSYDHQPGEHVFEIRYMNITPDNLSEITNYKFGQAPRVKLGEHVIQLSFRFNNGKISSIRVPKRVIESINRFELCN